MSRIKDDRPARSYAPAHDQPRRNQPPVYTIVKLSPKTIRLFLARGMACVGCPVGGLHTLQEACAVHKVDLDPLLAEITEVARTTRARFPQESFPLPG